MQINQILLFTSAAILISITSRGRNWLLLGCSTLAIFLIQPATPIRYLDFWLPTLTLGITILAWIVTRDFNNPINKDDIRSIGLISSIILVIGLNRYLGPFCCILPARPPIWTQVIVGLLILIILSIILWGLRARNFSASNFMTILLVALLIILKTDLFAKAASIGLRALTDQQILNASAFDIRWVGFSYVAFRLIHVLRDRATGRLNDVHLRELLIYTIFFPTFAAGPIDRFQRFIPDLDRAHISKDDFFWEGGYRISIGLFKKFFLADTLALIALNDMNAAQTEKTGWMWVLVYVYAFRLYFDFSGYTDIAVGIGKLMGFNLPENFNQPYLKNNLSQFWNAWHITLAQWFRTYYFNPLTRYFRSRFKNIPVWGIILVGQLSTMLLIGLWHGITLNYMIWGLWHGFGLFVHNRWTEIAQPKMAILNKNAFSRSASKIAGLLITFNYVSLGWVWFALSTPTLSWQVLHRLVGF